MQQQFYENVTNAINCTTQSVRAVPEDWKLMDSIGYLQMLKSYRFVSLSLPRQSGKTSYILSHYRAGDIIVCSSQMSTDDITKRVQNVNVMVTNAKSPEHFLQHLIDAGIAIKPRNIWFDDVPSTDVDNWLNVMKPAIERMWGHEPGKLVALETSR